jgi:hypothetical protein
MDCPDVIFVSSEEPDADRNFQRLLQFAPHARRVEGGASIYHAYQAAADAAATTQFFMVDGDNWMLDGFRFTDHLHNTESDRYAWRAVNAVNGLVNSHGGIKLLRREIVRTMTRDSLDYYSAMAGSRALVTRPASEHRFNGSPFQAWRGGFRECAKMTGRFPMTSKKAAEIVVWQTRGIDRPNGLYCVLGARMGAAFGAANHGSPAMAEINNKRFLEDAFARVTALEPLETVLPVEAGRNPAFVGESART